MSISLLGICGLQWYWVSKAIAEKEAEYDRAINRGLFEAVDELKSREIEDLFIKKLLLSDDGSIQIQTGNLTTDEDIEIIESTDDHRVVKKRIQTISSENGSLTTEVIVGQEDYREYRIGEDEDVFVFESKTTQDFRIPEGAPNDFTEKEANRFVQVLGDIIYSVELRDENNMPNVRSRIGMLDLDSLLESTFEREGVDAPFQYAVVYPENDSIQFEFANVGPSELVDLNFSVPVFSEFPESAELKVGFPSKDTFIIKSLGDVLAMVLVFSLLMLGTFIATLYAIVKQKRLAEVKSDFINNMTHEFKTPLATIGLAVDSIRHPQVKNDPAQIDRFTGIISEENKRLNGHVEKILQLAKMDNGELVAKPEPCDLNQLVADAVASMELRVQNREGSLEFDSDSTEGLVNVDCNHLYNVVVNLIDNALKYTEAKPEIKVKLWRTAGFISLTVQDNGIGMSNETQKKAFDSFYRAQSGDVHNVKGFGVGLSYVKEIVRLHHGEIIIRSALDKGSTVGFKIPVNGE